MSNSNEKLIFLVKLQKFEGEENYSSIYYISEKDKIEERGVLPRCNWLTKKEILNIPLNHSVNNFPAKI